MLKRSVQSAILNDKDGKYAWYWNLRPPGSGQTFKNYIQGTYDRKEKAVSLYEFLAGPYNTSEIGRIFAKYGIRWGAHFGFGNPKAKKDTMHFEWMPPTSMKGMVLGHMAGGEVSEFDPNAVQQVKQQTEQLAEAGVGISSQGGEGGTQTSSVDTSTAMSVEPG